MIRSLCAALLLTMFSAPLANAQDWITYEGKDGPGEGKHVVLITGDEEYRSEESMPLLADMLERDYGFRTTVLYALDDSGYVDPNRLDNIPGLKALEDADLMVLFTRWRSLPDSQLVHILRYAESGRPMVGFRTATHAFKYENDLAHDYLNNDWPYDVLGQRWITHHGHFDDGAAPLTAVRPIEWRVNHPILRGVEPFEAYSWLYHVEGGGDELAGDSKPLLVGRALRSRHEDQGRLDRYPLSNPVAWTKTYRGESGIPARVFFTTLGHPYDFRNENMRRLAINGILWALGEEERIPASGAPAALPRPYDPNNSGFGDRYKRGLRPR